MHVEIHNEIINQRCFFCNNEKNSLKGKIIDAPFSVSGEGYREMIEDLRKKNYLPKE